MFTKKTSQMKFVLIRPLSDLLATWWGDTISPSSLIFLLLHLLNVDHGQSRAYYINIYN